MWFRKRVNILAQVGLRQLLAIDEHLAPPELNSFAGKADDSFDSKIRAAVIDYHNVTTLDRIGYRNRKEICPGLKSRGHAGPAYKADAFEEIAAGGGADNGGGGGGDRPAKRQLSPKLPGGTPGILHVQPLKTQVPCQRLPRGPTQVKLGAPK